MNKADDIKPRIFSIGPNKGVFGTSANTYNQSGVTYNQASAVYGGGDTVTTIGPDVISFWTQIPTSSAVLTIKPSTFGGQNKGVFGNTTTTYNQATFSYNQAGQIYGGGDFLTDAGPHIIGIGIIDSAAPTPPSGQGGQPMGLLLTLTYPS